MPEKAADKASRLRHELQRAEAEVRKCPHEWGEPYPSSREEQKEYSTGEYEKQGVHFWPITRFRPVTINGWERACEKCGHTEFTTKSKPIVTGYEANFDEAKT